MGLPWMSSSGLPGKRLESNRAGMIPKQSGKGVAIVVFRLPDKLSAKLYYSINKGMNLKKRAVDSVNQVDLVD
jgi:hypothetical protein